MGEAKQPKKKKKSNSSLQLIVAVLVLACGGWYAYSQYETRVVNEATSILPPVPTLDPALFEGRAKAAYQVAKDIPDVLRHVHCFCGCKDAYSHQNNLFCFSDEHGSVCDMCMSIALESKRLHDEGKTTEEISKTIDQKFGGGDR